MSTPARRAAGSDAAAPVTAPLSWQQQQIWLHGQWAGAAPVYQETVAIRREGGWEETPLRAALEAWTRKYSLLRTTFPEVSGQAQQAIAAEPAAWELGQITVGSREDARRAAAADAHTALMLTPGPLWRALWARWPQGQELYLTLHHLIFDGYTLQRLWLPEWAAEYEARAKGQPPPPPTPAADYADYARWQRGGEDREAVERAPEHRDFWRRHLAGEWPRLALGGESGVGPFAAASTGFALPANLFAAVSEMARAARVTPFMVLLAGFAALLHRLTGQETMLIGVPAAGRSQHRWERIAGPMVNTLALRLTITADPPFAAVVRQARDVVLEALGHQDYPFALAMREAPRPAGADAALETYFSLQPPGEPPPAGWEMSHLAVDNGTAKFPLHLDLAWRADGAVEGRCRFQRARVDPTVGAALSGYWTVLLEAAVRQPEVRVGALPLLSAQQRRRLLVLGRGPEPPLPPGTVAEIFARQAAATPERVAMVDLEPPPGNQEESPPRRRAIRYGELQLDAEILAQGLRLAGVRPGDTVALALARPAEAVAAMLAIAWSGAAYMPLHLADPPRRQQRQLELAGVRWRIGGGPARGALGDSPGVLSLDGLREAAAQIGGHAAPEPAAQAAYVMCTSGSTGEPKALRIPHRGIVRLVCGARYAHFGPDETYLLLAPLSFDAATFEIWAPLLNGGRLIVPPPGLPSGAQLGEWIRQECVTTLWLTASWFNALIDSTLDSAPAVLAPLRQILTGGETLSPRHVRRAQQALPGVALFNGYGPTENTTFTCVYRIPPVPPQAAQQAIPLGRPIAHSTAFVADDYGDLAPEGVEGELWVGGAGLALEELGSDSSGRFVRPAWNDGEPLFRSGDRARWIQADSGPALAFLGRRDQLVKLRGMRLELEAIEALLLRHPRVRQAAVAVEAAGERRELTGYVATEASATELCDWLARDQPAAMIPARWVLRAELPRLPSGKLDRQALGALARGDGNGARAPAAPPRSSPAPANLTERKLERMWAQLLDREAVGREEDFYALGGHSLIALRLAAALEQEFGRRLSVAALMAHRTIAAQARWLQGAQTEPPAEEPLTVRLQMGDPALRPAFVSIEAIGRFLRLAEAMGPEQPWWGLRLGSLRQLPRPCPMAAIAACHLAALRSVQPRGPYYLAGFCQNGVVAFELARQLIAAGEPVACVALLDTVSPAFLRHISGARWPWFRLRYAWRQWRLPAPEKSGGGAGRTEAEEEEIPALLLLWRRWRYRWSPPGGQPRIGERTAVVQNAVRHYCPARLGARILLFRSTHPLLAAAMGRNYDPALGWEGLAAGGLEIHTIQGDHMSMFQPPGVTQMARVLSEVTAPLAASAAMEIGR